MRRAMSIFVLVGLLTDVHPLQAAPWETLPPLPSSRFGAAAAGLNGQLFVLGGFSDFGPLPNTTVWNQATLSWSEAAPMSRARLFFAAASTSTAVFAIGGFVDGMPSASAEKLDPSGSWTSVSPMPMARASFGAGVLGSVLYVAGGQGEDSNNLAECLSYDPAANAWTAIAPLPTPRAGVAVATLGGKLWVIGGMDGQPLATVECFDPASGWSASAALPEPLWFPGAAAFDGRIWVAGGMDASYQRSDRVYSAGVDGAWRSEASLPAPLAVSAMGTLGNCLAVVGGMDVSGMPSPLAFAQTSAAPPPPPPPDPLQVAVSLSPSGLNSGSHGNWIKADISPSGWSARDIVVSSLYLGGAAVDPAGTMTVDDLTLTVKFPRAAFTSLPAGSNMLTLVGVRADGTPIRGEVELTVSGSLLQIKKPGRALRPIASAGPTRGVVIHMDQAEDVRLDVMDLQGRVIDRLWQGTLAAGEHTREWPRAGARISRGAYFMRLQRPSGTEVTKLLVVR